MNTTGTAIMSMATAWVLIISAAATMVVGLAMLWASTTRTRPCRASAATPVAARTSAATAARPGPLAGWWSALSCTAAAGGAITGAQWAVLGHTSTAAIWAVALGLPSFLAGATLTRLLVLLHATHQHRRHTRAVRRGRGARR